MHNHSVRIREGNEWMTLIFLQDIEYIVIPFGLTNETAKVLRDMLNNFVLVYLYTIPDQAHQALSHLLEIQLYVKEKKFKCHVSSVSFLGFVRGRSSC